MQDDEARARLELVEIRRTDLAILIDAAELWIRRTHEQFGADANTQSVREAIEHTAPFIDHR